MSVHRKLDEAASTFEASFGAPPTHLARAPGRVNLIGEHTDYNGLPVFPMALQREVGVLFRPREDAEIRIANTDGEFAPRSFRLGGEIPPDPTGDWGNYLKAPCQELALLHGARRGFDALVSSDLPVASGLSSSSALVNAVGLTVAWVNGLAIPTVEMAETMARAERYTGTQGGGMDQAISLGAAAGHATRIEFFPLRLFPTPVPPEWRFVVAHTLVRAEKSGPAQAAYNLRTRECRVALEEMGAVVGHGAGGPGSPRGPTGAQPTPLRYSDLLTLLPVGELVELAGRHMEGEILKRFRHVVTEAVRVYEAEESMGRGDLLTFGLLMDASHESLRTDYEVSSPELDRLVELARGGGAAGARLTGAGFGGCMVALVHEKRVERVLAAMADGYYRDRALPGPLQDVLFVAEPSAGAGVTEL